MKIMFDFHFAAVPLLPHLGYVSMVAAEIN